MNEKKFILYVQTSDVSEKQYSPLVLAQTAKAMEIDARIYYLGMGLKILLPGAAEAIKMGAFPTVKEMMDKAIFNRSFTNRSFFRLKYSKLLIRSMLIRSLHKTFMERKEVVF